MFVLSAKMAGPVWCWTGRCSIRKATVNRQTRASSASPGRRSSSSCKMCGPKTVWYVIEYSDFNLDLDFGFFISGCGKSKLNLLIGVKVYHYGVVENSGEEWESEFEEGREVVLHVDEARRKLNSR